MSIPQDHMMDHDLHNPDTEPSSGIAAETRMPSEVVSPTRTDSLTQQASTQPGDGSKAHQDNGVEGDRKVPWKDEVIGYAKVTRGKVLGKKGTEELGHKILEGEVVPKETHKI